MLALREKIRKARTIYLELSITRESPTITCILAEKQKAAKEWGSFIVEKKKEGCRYSLTEGCWKGSYRQVTRNGDPV